MFVTYMEIHWSSKSPSVSNKNHWYTAFTAMASIFGQDKCHQSRRVEDNIPDHILNSWNYLETTLRIFSNLNWYLPESSSALPKFVPNLVWTILKCFNVSKPKAADVCNVQYGKPENGSTLSSQVLVEVWNPSYY